MHKKVQIRTIQDDDEKVQFWTVQVNFEKVQIPKIQIDYKKVKIWGLPISIKRSSSNLRGAKYHRLTNVRKKVQIRTI